MTRDLTDGRTESLLGPDLAPVDAALLPHGPLCAACYGDEAACGPIELACPHDPQTMAGAAMGMYHCPVCCAMVLAGSPHGPICRHCMPASVYEGEERRA